MLRLAKHLIPIALILPLGGCAWLETEEDETVLCEVDAQNRITNPPCDLIAPGKFVYIEEYGGRIDEIASQNLSGTAVSNNGLYEVRASLPEGWSDATPQMTLPVPAQLAPGNIRAGISIFGVMGTYASPQQPACVMTGGGGQQASECLASAGLYVYSTAYNGRSTTCALDGESGIVTACWVSSGGTWYLVDPATIPAVCTANGYQASGCRARSGHYFYTEIYGGRGRNCTAVVGNISGPCWMNITTSTDITFTSGGGAQSCFDNTVTPYACMTAGARYVYTSAYGGRGDNCARNNTGNCYFVNASKASLEPNLLPENVKAGVTIFGVTGSFGGENMWNSGAHRDQGVTPIKLSEETQSYSGEVGTGILPTGYYEVPKIAINDEGHYDTSNPSNRTVSPVDRSTWGVNSCGTAGSIDDRISDCNVKLGAATVWDGATKGHAGQSKWMLVTRTGNISSGQGREVWRDNATGMLWSSLVSVSTNWCRASGSNDSSAVADARFKEDDSQNICDNASYQSTATDAVSACFEGATGFTTSHASLNMAGKAGLTQSSTPAVNWRLPSLYDFEVAEYNGIRFVLPDMGLARASGSNLNEWTATVNASSPEQAWVVDSTTGAHALVNRFENAGVRCIGR